MDNKEKIHQRLLTAVEYLKRKGCIHKQQDIVERLDMPKSSVSEAMAGKARSLTDGFLRRFARAYGEHVSEHWLLTGQGRMDVPGRDERPHVSTVAASAGYLDGFSEPVVNPDFHKLSDLLPDYDFTMRARGDSMLPEIHSGDLLLCRRLDHPLGPADLGRIFVADTADGVLVKRLAAISPSDALTLHSLNPAYPDIDAPAASLRALARVVAVVHPVAPAHDQKSN